MGIVPKQEMPQKGKTKLFVLGITGKIAAGKSTIAHFFKEMNFPVFDADFIARGLQETDSLTQKKIKEKFSSVFDSNHNLNRQKLRLEVLKSELSLEQMEEIIFPEVKKQARTFIEQNQHRNLVILDVPLMWGSGINTLCDKIFYVETSEQARHERIFERGILSLAEIQRIEARQKHEEKYLTQEISFLKGDISLKETKIFLDSYLREKGFLS